MKLLSQGGRIVLLRHVLSSMASHILAIMDMPKVLIGKINSILATFFRGEDNERLKTKWRSWSRIRKPMAEGGLGIRGLSEVQLAMHMKLAWRLMSMDSLWSRFFLVKYARQCHVSLVSRPTNGSRLRRSIVSVILVVCE